MPPLRPISCLPEVEEEAHVPGWGLSKAPCDVVLGGLPAICDSGNLALDNGAAFRKLRNVVQGLECGRSKQPLRM